VVAVGAGALREPILHLSLFLKGRRDDYYRLIQEVRQSGRWHREGIDRQTPGRPVCLHEISRAAGHGNRAIAVMIVSGPAPTGRERRDRSTRFNKSENGFERPVWH